MQRKRKHFQDTDTNDAPESKINEYEAEGTQPGTSSYLQRVNPNGTFPKKGRYNSYEKQKSW
jgi:hypothetical protein